jgi:hypothetical protein
MTSTTPTSAPADLVGRGGIGVRPAVGHGVVRHAFGHGVATWRFIDHNGTTLGNLSPGGPQS